MTPLELARDALVMCDENSDGQQPDRVVVTLARALIAATAELERLRPVVEAAERWLDYGRSLPDPPGELRSRVYKGLAQELANAIDSLRSHSSGGTSGGGDRK